MAGLRVLVGEEPSERSRSTLWRIFTGRKTSDVYIAARPIAGDVKVSLHERGPWRYGFTQKHQLGPNPFVPPGEDRAKFKWERPPEQFPGVTRAFSIRIPSTELRDPRGPDPLKKPAVWIPPPPDGFFVEIAVFLHRDRAPGTWPGQRAIGTRLLYEQHLPNGQELIVVSAVHETSNEDRQLLDTWKATISGELQRVVATAAREGSDFRAALLASPKADAPPDSAGVWVLYDVHIPAP